MGRLSTHVLDIVAGGPAENVQIDLFRLTPDGGRSVISSWVTNSDGRTDEPLLSGAAMVEGTYELVFHIGMHFAAHGAKTSQPPFLDVIPIRFQVADAAAHYHVPLLVSPWSYSTYRGS